MMRWLRRLVFVMPLLAIAGFEHLLQQHLQYNYANWHVAITLVQFLLYFTAVGVLMAIFIKRKWNGLFSVSIFLALYLVIDLVFYFLLGMPPARQQFYLQSNGPGHISYDVGIVPFPNDTFHDAKVIDSDTIFSVDYTIDEYHRRVTPGHDPVRSKFAAFFGCSVCFGYGVEDNETLSYFLQKNACGINAYNFGYNGWGMHHMLARFDHENLAQTVAEKDGIAVYVFLWSHIRRAIGDMRIYTGWGHQMPHYTLENGELVRRGNFKDGRFWKSSFYTLVNSSFAARYFNVNLPMETDEQDYRLAVEIIAEAKNRYIEQFGNDRFVVLIHPLLWDEFTEQHKLEFLSILDEKGIEYLDYANAYPIDNDHKIVGDGHPNAFAYDKISKLIIKDLNLEPAPCNSTIAEP